MRKNIDPKVWGPHAWQFLADCAESIDEDSYDDYKLLIDLLPDVLPCAQCRGHCREYLDLNPLPSVEGIHNWLADFKSHVSMHKSLKGSKTGCFTDLQRKIVCIASALFLLFIAIVVVHLTNF